MKKQAATALCLLVLATPASATSVGGVTMPTQIGQAWDFYQRNKAWLQSLTDLQNLSKNIFNESTLKNIAGVALQRLANQGFDVAGIDVGGFLNDLQGQIDAIKENITKTEGFIASGAFLLDGSNKIDTRIAFNPDLQRLRLNAAKQKIEVAEATKVQLQNTADSATVVKETLKTADTLRDKAKDTAATALDMGTALNGADSTRASVQVLGQVMLEDLNNRMMSDAALAAQFAQLAKSMDITNQNMGALVTDIIARKQGEAEARNQLVNQRIAEAEAQAQETVDQITQTQKTISKLVQPGSNTTDTAALMKGN
ncbi:hypothetical protein Dxin01_00773 [Deinococcus xinjiangensis]|uniref:Uncharacterized protein n=1 Tax=Deinococcus xinjiangensis TaxID=457454 RepID=A0ABP9V702_9DEIO